MTAVTAPAKWEGQLFSGGWRAAHGGTVDVVDKATGEVIGTVGLADATDVTEAAARAAAAQPGWAATSFEERAAILRRAADLLEERAPSVIEWLIRETGEIRARATHETRIASARSARRPASRSSPTASCCRPPSAAAWLRPACADRRRRRDHALERAGDPRHPRDRPRARARQRRDHQARCADADHRRPAAGLDLRRGRPARGPPARVPGAAEAGEAIVTDPSTGLISFTGSTAVGRRVGELAGRT